MDESGLCYKVQAENVPESVCWKRRQLISESG